MSKYMPCAPTRYRLLLFGFLFTALVPSLLIKKNILAQSNQSSFEGERKVSAFQSKLHFVIVAPHFRFMDATHCGGCTVLLDLGSELDALGHKVSIHLSSVGPNCIAAKPNSVIIYPEVVAWTCEQEAMLHVRWILAPIGIHAPKSITKQWAPDNWVVQIDNNELGIPTKIPDSNILHVLHNPTRFDEFETVVDFQKTQNNVSCFTYRKAARFHNMTKVVTLHPPDAVELPQRTEEVVELLKRCTTLYSYDPYTFLNHLAAWFGCVTVLHPLEGVSKHEWSSSTGIGAYVRYSGSTVIFDAVAYGPSEHEITEAKLALPKVKDEFYKVREWGKQTVVRFCEDVYSYMQNRSDLRMRKLVRDYYPDGW